MKKGIFKTLVIAVLLITAFMFNEKLSATTNRPDSIKIDGQSLNLPTYLEGYKFSGMSGNGGIIYCLDYKLASPLGLTAYYYGERDAGFAYVLANGYPHKSITGNKEKDITITQMALWMYLDTTTGSKNIAPNFDSISDQSGLRGHIYNLFNNAMIARSKGYEKPTVSLRADNGTNLVLDNVGKYFESSLVTVSGTKLTGTYNVKVVNAPAGTIITDANSNARNSFSLNEKFKVKVDRNNLESFSQKIEVSVTAPGEILKAYEYRVGDGKYQPTTTSVLYPEGVNVNDTIKFTLKTSKVRIAKLDKENNKPLPGATLVIKDSNNQVVKTWVSTNNYLVLENLEDGKYYISEVIAPNGYKLNKEVLEFTIDNNNRDITVKFYNEPKTNVVTITKIDAKTNLPLAGAKLVIKDATGKVVREFITTNEPYVITDLADGIYTLIELEAPEGYTLSGEVHEFVISDKQNSHQIIFNNYKDEVEVPPTDVNSQTIITVLGTILMASGAGYIYLNDKKRYN